MIKEFKGHYGFLNNFYPSPINFGEHIYPTAEHLFQAMKIDDQNLKRKIRLAPTPGWAKRLGQTVQLSEDWELLKDSWMDIVVRMKFLQNSELLQALIGTEETELIEGNYWHDNYWGDCLCKGCSQIKGKNQLGKTLMKVRKDIG